MARGSWTGQWRAKQFKQRSSPGHWPHSAGSSQCQLSPAPDRYGTLSSHRELSGSIRGAWHREAGKRTHKRITRHHFAEIAMLYGPPSAMIPIKGQVHPSVTRVNWKLKTQSNHPELKFLAFYVLHCESPAAFHLCQTCKRGCMFQYHPQKRWAWSKGQTMVFSLILNF